MIVIVLSRLRENNIQANFENGITEYNDLNWKYSLCSFVVLLVLLIWYSLPRLDKKKRVQYSNVAFYPPA